MHQLNQFVITISDISNTFGTSTVVAAPSQHLRGRCCRHHPSNPGGYSYKLTTSAFTNHNSFASRVRIR
jgi:hypothetical protein